MNSYIWVNIIPLLKNGIIILTAFPSYSIISDLNKICFTWIYSQTICSCFLYTNNCLVFLLMDDLHPDLYWWAFQLFVIFCCFKQCCTDFLCYSLCMCTFVHLGKDLYSVNSQKQDFWVRQYAIKNFDVCCQISSHKVETYCTSAIKVVLITCCWYPKVHVTSPPSPSHPWSHCLKKPQPIPICPALPWGMVPPHILGFWFELDLLSVLVSHNGYSKLLIVLSNQCPALLHSPSHSRYLRDHHILSRLPL